jgi:hypothetical protein
VIALNSQIGIPFGPDLIVWIRRPVDSGQEAGRDEGLKQLR